MANTLSRADIFKINVKAIQNLLADPQNANQNAETQVVETHIAGVNHSVHVRAVISDDNKLVNIYSVLPFVAAARENSDFARKLSQFNYDKFFFGGYDYNPETGKIVFRIGIPVVDEGYTQETANYAARFVLDSVNSTNQEVYELIESAKKNTDLDGSEKSEVLSGVSGVDKLVGWDDFKALCHEIYDVSGYVSQKGLTDSFMYQNFLLSADDGYGITTAMEYLAKLAADCAFLSNDADCTVNEYAVASEDGNGRMTPDKIINDLDSDDYNAGCVLFDISAYLEKSVRTELKSFFLRIAQMQERYIFVFRVPFLEPGALEDVRKLIADIFYVRVIKVPPFSYEQLKECADRFLKEKGLGMDDEAAEVFRARVNEEKSDGRFYGIKSIHKIVYEMIWEKCKADIALPAGERNSTLISQKEILSISDTFNKPVRDGFAELSELVGMDEITQKIREIVTQVKTAMSMKGIDKPCLHMRFEGAPGTGKTTVARILGRIFRENGILRNGYFFEYTARDLVGAYVGQTAPKTAAICRDAYGSVLFIDEAYALYSSDSDSKDYGREALTTLISEMENHRDDMVVIMAGYTDEMKELMEGNAGLRSRMPFILEFKSYTKAQLADIYMKFASANFKMTDDFEAAVREYFDSLSESYIASKEFANARFARNLYERTWSKAALRCSLNNQEIVLTREDFINASSEKEFSEKLMTRNKLGF